MDKISSMQPLMWMYMTSNTDNNNNTINYHFILTLLIIVLPYITKIIPFEEMRDQIYEYLTKDNNYVTINIPTHPIPITRGASTIPFIKLAYSKTFISIIHHINNNTKIDFLSKTEIMISNTELSNYYFDYDNNRIKDNYLMMPIHNEKILISEKYQIYFQLKECSEKQDTDNKNGTTNITAIKSKQFVIILSRKKSNKDLSIINHFIEECVTEYEELENIKLKDKRQYIYEYKGSEKEENKLELKYNEHLMEHNKDLTTNIFFEEKDKLINYIKPFVYDEHYMTNPGEEKYKKSGFTFKAGLMFYGYPGCGKTSTIKAILKYTNRHGILINLSKIKTCEELENIFRNRMINKRELSSKQICFILEDCDAFENNIIKSRDLNEEQPKLEDLLKKNDDIVSLSKVLNFTKSDTTFVYKDDDKINLSCFLNILDGIIELHGIMIIMTTNYPEKIDYALIRPGRFDFKYEFKRASKNIILEMLRFKFELSEKQIDKCRDLLNIKDEILSPAEVQSVCFKTENVYDAINELVLLAQK